jgi:tubulin-like protein
MAVITEEPTLIVGLGGAGGQTIARIKNLVEQIGRVPPTMHFLYVDTDSFEALDPSVRRVLDRHQDFLNISNFNPREWIEAQFNSQSSAAEDVRDWYDTQARTFVPFEHIKDGASRLRMLGRICLFKHRFDVEERISEKITACLSGAAELDQNRPLESGPRPFKILIVSGTCGGTGSGTFLDVLYMLSRAAVVDFHLAPQTNAFLYLPDLFVRLNQRISEMNVPLYQANGWAFLDELDYFIKNPSQMNEYACDARSADRRPYPVGTGIPAGVDLVYTAFLIDSKIPNVGIFESPRDLYAFASRAIFQSQITPMAGSVASFFSNVKNYLLERDAQRQRPKRYAALGYAELRYPKNVFSAYLGLRYQRDVIAQGILRTGYDPRGPQKDAEAWVRQILNERIEPAMKELEKAKTRALEALPNEASFETEGDPPKIDGARLSESSLKSEIDDALKALERAVSTLHIRFSAERKRISEELGARLADEIDTAGGGMGLPYLLEVLALVDRALEGELAKLLEKERSPEAYEERFRSAKAALLAPGGIADQLAKLGRSFFGKERAVRGRLPVFLGALRGLVETRFEGELIRCRVQMLRSVSGDPEDRDPVIEVYDDKTGAIVKTEVARSLLDSREDIVIAAMGVHMSTLVGVLSVEQLGGKLFRTEGEELTTRYVVPAASMDDLKSNPFLEKLFEESSHLSPDKVRQEVLDVLREAREKGFRLSSLGGATFERERLEPLREVLEARSRTRIGEKVDKSVMDVVASFPDDQRERLLTDLARASTPSITINDGVLDPVADQIVRIRTVSVEKPEHAAYLKNESFSVVPGTKDRFAAMQAYFAFPLYAVRGVLGLQQAYLNRDRLRNFPHTDRRFNERGLPESLGQESFAASDAALLTFARARAISEHVLENAVAMKELARHIELERDRFGDAAKVSLVDYAKRDGGWTLLVYMIDQDPERRIRFRVHSPLELGSADLRANLTTYGKSAAYLQNHARFVDSLEILEGELQSTFVDDAYQAYLVEIEKEIQEARAKKEDARMRVLLAMGRLLDAHQKALERDRASAEPL